MGGGIFFYLGRFLCGRGKFFFGRVDFFWEVEILLAIKFNWWVINFFFFFGGGGGYFLGFGRICLTRNCQGEFCL